MSTEMSSPQSEVLPAVMLAMLLAITGLETAFLLATPHKVSAHPVKIMAMLDGHHMHAAN